MEVPRRKDAGAGRTRAARICPTVPDTLGTPLVVAIARGSSCSTGSSGSGRLQALRHILDVGCGDGLFFERLEEFGAVVEGLEPDATLVADPRWRSQIRTLPLGPGACDAGASDLVLMLDVLEHIADDRDALRAVRDALSPGGFLLLTVPALAALWSRHDEANEHHRRYGPMGLREVLEASGLEVVTLRYFFAWTVAPLLVRRWLAPAGVGPRAGSGSGAADYAVPVPPPRLASCSRGSAASNTRPRQADPLAGGQYSLLAVARRSPSDPGAGANPHPISPMEGAGAHASKGIRRAGRGDRRRRCRSGATPRDLRGGPGLRRGVRRADPGRPAWDGSSTT